MPVERIRMLRKGPALTHVARAGQADRLYEELRAAILSGTLAPNERLVEASIAAASQVSRTPVREALHRLAMDGLVQETGRGVVVCPVDMDHLGELCAVRETLEGMVTRLAALARSEAELTALRRTHEEFQHLASEGGSATALIRLSHTFHAIIWQASHNRYLAQQLRAIREQIERVQNNNLFDSWRRSSAISEHELILRAIEARDPEAAELAARAHYQEATALRLVTAQTVHPQVSSERPVTSIT